MNMSLTSISPSSAARTRTDHLVATVLDLHRRLEQLADLRPCPVVDDLFGALVQLAVKAPDDVAAAALRAPQIRAVSESLRQICATGETALEREWASRISAHEDPATELARFPYFGNYAQLSRMELGVLASATRGPTASVAFVGGGPLPLSALMISAELEATVDVIDRDAEALDAARRVAQALYAKTIGFRLSEAATCDVSGYDVVVIAAMVGSSASDKRRILDQMSRSMSADSILLVRSAHGLRTLLYPPVPDDGLRGFDVLTVVRPVNDVINSVVLARPRR
jgi:nicotianamine synthase